MVERVWGFAPRKVQGERRLKDLEVGCRSFWQRVHGEKDITGMR